MYSLINHLPHASQTILDSIVSNLRLRLQKVSRNLVNAKPHTTNTRRCWSRNLQQCEPPKWFYTIWIDIHLMLMSITNTSLQSSNVAHKAHSQSGFQLLLHVKYARRHVLQVKMHSPKWYTFNRSNRFPHANNTLIWFLSNLKLKLHKVMSMPW